MPKVFIFRSIAVLVLVLPVFEWAMPGLRPRAPARDAPSDLVTTVRGVANRPGSWVLWGSMAVLVANVIASFFSPVKSGGISGRDVR